VAYEIHSPLLAALDASSFSSTSIPSPLMIAYTEHFLAVAFVLAIRKFQGMNL
jgi:hypothetical protein